MMSTKTKTAPLSSYRDPIILITGCVIGAILGLVFGDKVSFLKPIGQIFLNLLFCLIVPLIFFSIAGSIANTKDTGKVGKMIWTNAPYFCNDGHPFCHLDPCRDPFYRGSDKFYGRDQKCSGSKAHQRQ